MGKIKDWCKEHETELTILGTAVVSAGVAGGIVYSKCAANNLTLKPGDPIKGSLGLYAITEAGLSKAAAVNTAMTDIGGDWTSPGRLVAVALDKGETVKEVMDLMANEGHEVVGACVLGCGAKK